MQTHQIGKSDARSEVNASYFHDKQNVLPKRPMLIPPGSPLLPNQFHLKQPPYPPHLLNHLYMNNINNAAMARDHPLYWARNDLRQRIALASPRMDYYHQESTLNHNVVKENGKEPQSAVSSEGDFVRDGPEQVSDPETNNNNQRKVGHSIKTGVSLRCAYCNGDFRSR